MEPASRLDKNHQLSIKELPYIIQWREDRCTRCGRCTAVCPMKAIEATVYTQRVVSSVGANPEPKVARRLTQVVRQSTEIERYCIGCGTCTLVCPTDAIFPEYNFQHKLYHYKNKGGIPFMRGGRRNDPSTSTLDKLKFTRISMLTD
ncbi:MAG TPA: 4Fe-4S binding protein, partial [Nitrospirota bacterium]